MTPQMGLFVPRHALRETQRTPRSLVAAGPVILCGPNQSWKTPPFSALISNLRDAENFRSETARQLSVLFENEVKPRSCPDHPVSPVIGARQDIFSGKGGVLAIATHDTRVVEGRIPRPKSPITSPNPKSKPSISRPYNSTLIPRGNHRDRKTRDKPKTRPSTKNKPENIPEQEEDLENKFV